MQNIPQEPCPDQWLPLNPLKTLNISPFLKGIILASHFIASVLRFWKRPWKKARADFGDMGLLDKIYWTYKSKEIIKKPEKGLPAEIFQRGFRYKQEGTIIRTKALSLSAAGDLIKNDLLENSGGILYKKIEEALFHHDISTANLESLYSLSPGGNYEFSGKATPALNGTPGQVTTLIQHEKSTFTILNIANNHSLDEGVKALRKTGKKLRAAGIVPLGFNAKPEDSQKGVVIEKKGMKVGFVSATFGLNGKTIPRGEEYTVNITPFHQGYGQPVPGVFSTLINQIEACRREGCGIIIAQLHWGYEYEMYPRLAQVQTAHEIIEAGADVILSHHSHVVQPYEIYTPRRAPHKKTLISYSLGNLTSNFRAPALTLSALLHFKICEGIINGREDLFIDDIEFIPVLQHEKIKEGRHVVEIMKLEDMPSVGKEIQDIIFKVFGVPV